MNTFVTIEHVGDYRKVKYYTVHIEDDADNLFQQFIDNHKNIKEKKEELVILLNWLTKIGNETGAKEKYFRNEAATSDTKALPPPRYIENDAGNLRLYCMVCNERVVILYSGGIKTTRKAQDCSNVAGHFRLANRLTKAINQAFIDKEISWNDSQDDILFNENMELEI